MSEALNGMDAWQWLMFFSIFYVIGFLHGRFPQESRRKIKRKRKTPGE